MTRGFVRSGLALALLAAPSVAHATPPARPPITARFALIIGVNHSVDADSALLRYADDDAAKYQDLFRGLGARTYLLSRLDENTERLHPQAAAEAREPTRAELTRALAQLEADVTLAQRRNVRTVVYVVYSGHGNVENGRAYLALENSHVFGSDLDALIFDKIKASEYHVIVDACYSYLLATPRGPGGKRREMHGFASNAGIRPHANVGLLFSTASARESHEWAGIEGGVFSHEVRSGLYGAADADGDGVVTYAEIASFVRRANAAIPGDRFRPEVYARPPSAGEALVDLRNFAGHRIVVGGAEHAHYRLEDSRGVQVAEFNNGPNQSVTLLRPAQTELLYLRRVGDDSEFAIPPGQDLVSIASLTPERSAVAERGAATHAYGTLFSLPFGPNWVEPIRPDPNDARTDHADDGRTRRWLGWGLVGLGAAGATVGLAAGVSEAQLHGSVSAGTPQASAADVKQRITTRHWEEGIGFGLGAAAAISGVVLLLQPDQAQGLEFSASAGRLDFSGHF